MKKIILNSYITVAIISYDFKYFLPKIKTRALVESVLAMVLLLIILPLLIIIATFVAFDLKRFPIFIQERIGKNGKRFLIFKFSTMVEEGILTDSRDRTREINQKLVTPLGSFLRKTKLDELPQLLNIIKGEMSFLGYRPLVPMETKVIYNQLPGLMGLQQLLSLYDDNDIDALQWVDSFYYENKCSWMDIYIMIKTIQIIVLKALAPKRFCLFLV